MYLQNYFFVPPFFTSSSEGREYSLFSVKQEFLLFIRAWLFTSIHFIRIMRPRKTKVTVNNWEGVGNRLNRKWVGNKTQPKMGWENSPRWTVLWMTTALRMTTGCLLSLPPSILSPTSTLWLFLWLLLISSSFLLPFLASFQETQMRNGVCPFSYKKGVRLRGNSFERRFLNFFGNPGIDERR